MATEKLCGECANKVDERECPDCKEKDFITGNHFIPKKGYNEEIVKNEDYERR